MLPCPQLLEIVSGMSKTPITQRLPTGVVAVKTLFRQNGVGVGLRVHPAIVRYVINGIHGATPPLEWDKLRLEVMTNIKTNTFL